MLVSTRRLRSLGLALGLSVATLGAAWGQEDKVVATVNGQPVTESDLTLAATELDPQMARLPDDQRRAAALSRVWTTCSRATAVWTTTTTHCVTTAAGALAFRLAQAEHRGAGESAKCH